MDKKPYEVIDSESGDLLLSQELLQLSTKDRNALEEEIPGVRCLAVEETPELLQISLQKLAMVLVSDHIIPPSEKQAYLQSQRLPRTFVNTSDFRLRFLRVALFDVVMAAKQIVRYLEVTSFAFGQQMLERPIRLSDFNKKELQFFRSGAIQFLPFRDRSGRRIMIVINPSFYSVSRNEEFLLTSYLYVFRIIATSINSA